MAITLRGVGGSLKGLRGVLGLSPLNLRLPPRNFAAATFVLENHYAPSGNQVVSWAGASVGDLALILITNSSTTGPVPPAGFTLAIHYTWASFGYHDYVYWKVLDQADVTAGNGNVSAGLGTDGIMSVLVYRGANSVSIAGTGDDASAPVVPGFVKNSASRKIVTYMASRAPSLPIVSPAGMISRLLNYTFAGHNFQQSVDDMDPSSYIDGTPLSYTGGGTETIAVCIELTLV